MSKTQEELERGAQAQYVLENLRRPGTLVIDARANDRQDGAIGRQHHLAKLFQKFYQVDPSSTRRQGGAGLGLSIAKGLLEATGGGTVNSVETDDENGATYEVDWKVGKSTYKGVGIKDGSKLIVGWSTTGGAGIVLYKVQGKKLDGVWSNPGEGKTSVEVLEK
mgnify:CR=1 FL=1